MDALRIRQMQLAMASARHELLYTRGRFINETLGPDRRAVEEWLTKGRAVLNVVDELRRLPACHQS